MPRPVEWLQRLPASIEALQDITTPVISRAMLQQLLGVHRRTAIRLMEKFGGYCCGKTYLIERVKLVDALKRIEAGESYTFETGRRERLAQRLDVARRESKARAVEIPVAPDVWGREVGALPATVSLQPGRLEITFADTGDCLRQLMELAQAISNDFEGFERKLQSGENRGVPRGFTDMV